MTAVVLSSSIEQISWLPYNMTYIADYKFAKEGTEFYLISGHGGSVLLTRISTRCIAVKR